ncbi:ABC transporter permease, partial [Lactiplantibacillus pentosus]
EHYQTLFADKRLLAILLETIMLALLSSLAATVLGTFGAIAIQRSKEANRKILLSFNNILIVSPDVIIGASFLILFTALGFSLGFASVLL